MNELTQDLVKELFDYQDGELYWKVSKGTAKIGNLAGTLRKDGYRQVKIDGKKYLAHRLIFLYHHGYLPQYLDHIDGDPLNNDIGNLRESTNQENCMNRKKQVFYDGKLTSSDFKGVTWFKRDKKWQAQIVSDGKMKYLGLYDSEIKAAIVYDKAAIERDGEFAKTNAMLYPEIFNQGENR